jgi:hypothetical protein
VVVIKGGCSMWEIMQPSVGKVGLLRCHQKDETTAVDLRLGPRGRRAGGRGCAKGWRAASWRRRRRGPRGSERVRRRRGVRQQGVLVRTGPVGTWPAVVAGLVPGVGLSFAGCCEDRKVSEGVQGVCG